MPPASASRRVISTRVTFDRLLASVAVLSGSSGRPPTPRAGSMTAIASAAKTNQVRWTMVILPTVNLSNPSLLHDLGDLEHDLVGEGDAERLGGLHIDDEVEEHRP